MPTFHALTTGFALKGDLENLQNIVNQLRDQHFLQPDSTIWGNTIEALMKHQKWKEVFSILEQVEKTAPGWTFKLCRAFLFNLKDQNVPPASVSLWRSLSSRFEKRSGESLLGEDDVR